MKRIIVLLTTLIIVFTFIACDNTLLPVSSVTVADNGTYEEKTEPISPSTVMEEPENTTDNAAYEEETESTAIITNNSEKRKGEVKTSSESSVQKGRNYQDVFDDLKKTGFTNIKTKILYDLITGWLTKDGEVKSVSVDGNENYKADVWYPNDVEVIITYHTFPNKNITLNELSLDVPANWRKEAQGNTGFFFYPTDDDSDGLLYIGFREIGESVPNNLDEKKVTLEHFMDFNHNEDFIRHDLIEYNLEISGCYAVKNISVWEDYNCIYYYILTDYNLYLIGIDIYETSPANLEDILENVVDSITIILESGQADESKEEQTAIPTTERTIEPTTEKPTSPPTKSPTTEKQIEQPTTGLTGYHTQEYANGDKYSGNFVNGIRSGQGKYEWADGIIYEGEFIDGNPSDNGNYNYPTEAPTEPPKLKTQDQIVYWGQTGNKIHKNRNCRTFKYEPFSGTIEEAEAAGHYGWCKVCS